MTAVPAASFRDTVVEAAAKAVSSHEVYGGGWFCSCQPVDVNGLRESLPVGADKHLARVGLAAAVPLLLAEAERRIEKLRDDTWENAKHNFALDDAVRVIRELAKELGTDE